MTRSHRMIEHPSAGPGRSAVCIWALSLICVLAGCENSGALTVRLETSRQALEDGVVWPPAGAVAIVVSVTREGATKGVERRFEDLDQVLFTLDGIPEGEGQTLLVEFMSADDWPASYGLETVNIVAGETTESQPQMRYPPTADETGPGQAGVSIDGGAKYTNDLEVALTFSARRATGVTITNVVSDEKDGKTEFYSSLDPREWPLEKGDDGPRLVRVQFKDDAGYESRQASASIVLDTLPPQNGAVQFKTELFRDIDGEVVKATLDQTVQGYFLVDAAHEMSVSADTKTSVTLPEKIRIPGEDATPVELGELLPYAPLLEFDLPLQEGVYRMEAVYRDEAGDETDPVADTIYLVRPAVALLTIEPSGADQGACAPPEQYAAWAIAGGSHKFTGITDAHEDMDITQCRWLTRNGPEGELQETGENCEATKIDEESGEFTIVAGVPDGLPDGTELYLHVAAGFPTADGTTWGSVPKEAPVDTGTLVLPLLVDSTLPAIEDAQLEQPVYGSNKVSVTARFIGACTATFVEEHADGTLREVLSVPVPEDDHQLDLDLLLDAETENLMLKAADGAGNVASLSLPVLILSEELPKLCGFTLQCNTVKPLPEESAAVKSSDLVQVSGEVRVFGCEGEESMPVEGAVITSVEMLAGGTPVPGAEITTLQLLPGGQLTGSFVVPPTLPAPGGWTSMNLAVRVQAPWGQESAEALSTDLTYYSGDSPLTPGDLLLAGPPPDAVCVADTNVEVKISGPLDHFVRLGGDAAGQNVGDWLPLTPDPIPVTLTKTGADNHIVVELSDPAYNVSTATLSVRHHDEPPSVGVQIDLGHPAVTAWGTGPPLVNQQQLPVILYGPLVPPCGPILFEVVPLDVQEPDVVPEGEQELLTFKKITLDAEQDGLKEFKLRFKHSGLYSPLPLASETSMAVELDMTPPSPPVITLPGALKGFLSKCQADVAVQFNALGQDTDEAELDLHLSGPGVTVPAEETGEDGWIHVPAPESGLTATVWFDGKNCDNNSKFTVTARTRDIAGNESNLAGTQVTVNTQPPDTPQLLPPEPAYTNASSMKLLRETAQDADFKGVNKSVCAWCNGAKENCSCTPAQASESQTNEIWFDLAVADTTYAVCVQAEDIFFELGEWECAQVSRDGSPPVSMLHCFDGDEGETPNSTNTRPCHGDRLARNQLLHADVGEKHDPQDAQTWLFGLAGLGEAEGIVYDESPFVHDTSCELKMSSVDASGNKESPRSAYLSFRYDVLTHETGMPPRFGASVTPLQNGDVLLVGGSPGDGATLDDWVVLKQGSLVLPDTELQPDEYAQRYGHSPWAHSELHSATRLPDGRVVLAGGGTRNSPDEVVVHHGNLRVFSADGQPEEEITVVGDIGKRAHHTAAFAQGRFVIFGGVRFGAVSTVLDDILVVDPETWDMDYVSATIEGPSPRFGAAAVALDNGKILVSGGLSEVGGQEGALASVLLVDPLAPEQWIQVETPDDPRALHSATLLHNGNVLLAGGVTEVANPLMPFLTAPLNSAAVLSPAGELVAGPVEESVPGGLYHTATLLPDGTVMLSGGFGSGNVRNQAVILDEQATPVVTIDDMGGGRVLHGAVLAPPDHVVLLGGTANPVQEGETSGDAVRLQGETGAHEVPEQSKLARIAHSATLLPDGNILVAGGWTNAGQTSSAALVSPNGQLLHYFESENLERGRHGALVLPSGNLLLMGGQSINFESGTQTAPFAPVDSAVVLDPSTGEEIQFFGSEELFERIYAEPLLLDERRVLIAGGCRMESGEMRGDVLVLHLDDQGLVETDADGEPVMDNWPDVLSPPRTEHSVTLLEDGRVLVAGGCTASAYATALQDAYVLSMPEGGAPVVEDHIESIGLRRCGHMAALLPNGNVALTGGASEGSIIPDDPTKTTGVILSGAGPSAGHALMEMQPLSEPWLHSSLTAMSGGNLLMAGGMTTGSDAERRSLARAVLFNSEGTIVETLHHPAIGAGDLRLLLLPDGRAMAVGGGLGSPGGEKVGQIVYGGIVYYASMTQSIPPGDLWYGAKLTGTTGPVLPGQNQGVNFHVPPPACLGTDDLQSGWDRTYALHVREDETFHVTADPETPGQDLSLYVVMMHTDRNGHLCYVGSDIDKGSGAETVQFTASVPETHGAGTYYVVVDSKVPNTPVDYTIYVYKHPSELAKMMAE